MSCLTPGGGVFRKSAFAPELGCTLSTRSEMFVLEDDHPNGLVPGKRPRTTLVSYLICEGGVPTMTVGCPGGDDQSQADLQLVLNLLVFGMNPQQAVEAPRFSTQTLVNSFYPRVYRPGQLNVEPGIPERTRAELGALGHEVTETGALGLGAVGGRGPHQTGALDVASVGVAPLRVACALHSFPRVVFTRECCNVDFLGGFAGGETSPQTCGVKFEGADEQPPVIKVTGKIRRSRPSMLDHFTFLKSATTRTAKFCLPSPVMLHARGDRPTLEATYPDLDEFWSDLTAAYRAEIRALCEAGCTYLQIDDTTVAMMCDPKVREQVKKLGDDPERLPGLYAEQVNAALRDVPRDVTVAIHTCRGNFKSTWMATGGYDPVAETVFTRINVNAFFLEYDTDRAGGFEPLA